MKGVGFLSCKETDTLFLYIGNIMNGNKNRKPQKQKEYSREPKKKKLKKEKIKKADTNIIDEMLLFNCINGVLEKNNIYLLDLKVRCISENKKVYAVIYKIKESVSHSHCIETTRIIQEAIKSNGYDEGDYTITVSSAGFRWKFNDRYELFEDMPIKIKYRNGEDFVTAYALLKEAKKKKKNISITDEDNALNEKNIKIFKNDIIKARLNC